MEGLESVGRDVAPRPEIVEFGCMYQRWLPGRQNAT